MIKAINTYYNGHYFRSRLEARWAVFFNELEIKYQYEPEGYVLSDGQRYLPDFYLPQFKCFAEVKPDITGIYYDRRFKESLIYEHSDFNKWQQFSKERVLILLIGNPHLFSIPLIQNQSRKVVVNEGRAQFWMPPTDDIECADLNYIEAVGFYNDSDGWRLWRGGSGDEEFYELGFAVNAANRKRFEHQ